MALTPHTCYGYLCVNSCAAANDAATRRGVGFVMFRDYVLFQTVVRL